MRDHFKPRSMAVADLKLDADNPRLSGESKSQVQCIGELIKLNKRHFETIVKDIASKGLTPLPIILGRNSEEEIVVKDGNRRVAALLVLNNIDLCSDDKVKQNLMKILKNIEDPHRYETLECLFCENDDVIDDYIERLHQGALDGAGQIVWDAAQNERHRANKGKKVLYPVGFPVHTWLTEQGLLDEDHNIKISNLQRILANPDIRKRLGFELKKNKVSLIADEKDVTRIWKILIDDFIREQMTVSKIKSLAQRKKYIDRLFKKHGLNELTELDSPEPISASTGKKTMKGKAQTGQRRKPTWNRSRIIPHNHRIIIPKPPEFNKANDILREMREGVDVKLAPHAAAIMLRTFLEITLVHFCKQKKIYPPDDRLGNLLNKAIAYCNQNNIFEKDQREALSKLPREELIDSLNTFNKFVHSTSYQAIWESANKFYNNYEFFLVYCWDELGGGHS